LTWHRPYLALFEQKLYDKVQEVAAKLPENIRARYVEAAKDFRLPYYDVALNVDTSKPNSTFVPDLIISETPFLNNKDLAPLLIAGSDKTPRNPLFRYVFPGDANQPDKDTFRFNPSTNRNPQASDRVKNQISSLRTELSNIMLLYKDFTVFSNNAWPGTGKTRDYGSLENIHDSIHGAFGGYMGSFDTSAFDPVFWLHHCNIDRLAAIWQAINPTSYVTSEELPVGNWPNFFIAKDSTVNASTDLEPFRPSFSRGRFYKSTDVEDTTAFFYAYPETQKWNYKSDLDYNNSLVTAVKKLYSNIPKVREFLRSAAAAPAPAPEFAGSVMAQEVADPSGGDELLTADESELVAPSEQPPAAQQEALEVKPPQAQQPLVQQEQPQAPPAPAQQEPPQAAPGMSINHSETFIIHFANLIINSRGAGSAQVH
jgi:tyrosinase